MRLALLVVASLWAAPAILNESQAVSITVLDGSKHHVQGIDTDGSILWVTSVDRYSRRGLLQQFELSTGKLVRTVEVQDGDRFHPGGMAADAEWLWIPVAEYRSASSAVIQKRNRKTLELAAQFRVDDHIGCVAVSERYVVGGNWDSREFYVWDRSGSFVRKVANTTGNGYQDLKFVGDAVVGAGLLSNRQGAIDWLEFPSMKLVRRLEVGKTSRGVALTHEGMAIRGGKLYLLPEDAPSRLFAFNLRP